jgi:uncharacterized protein
MLDIDTLVQFNPWWTQKRVPQIFVGEHQRPQFKTLSKYLDKRFIILIYGIRRVGKTTLMYQLIDYLLKKKTDPSRILYFSFDDKSASLEELIKIYQEKVIKDNISDSTKIFLFFDEIQKLPDWQSKIKILYDLRPNIKILISGSASVSLQKKSRESLAGRITDFFIKPLSFSEFLHWKNIKVDLKKPEMYQAKMKPLFADYLRKGGFPEIVGEKEDELVRNYLKNTVLERIIYRDLVSEFDLKDSDLMKLLVEMFMKDPGAILNVDSLSRDLGRTKVTINSYLDYLSYALLTRPIRNLRAGFKVSSRKGRKIYPSSPAFCFAYRNDFFTEKVLQKVAEASVAEMLDCEYYYRNGFEVDFVIKKPNGIFPIEVKYGNKAGQKQICKFLDKFDISKGLVISKEIFSSTNNRIQVCPLWYAALIREKLIK